MRSSATKKPTATGSAAPPTPSTPAPPTPDLHDGDARVYIGDCREIIGRIPECAAGEVNLIFADPPFNWRRAYDEWNDDLPATEYLEFTFDWIDACVRALHPRGAFWINIPDDWAAEIVCYLKGRLRRVPPSTLHLVNWCVWHYRFGQNTKTRFINSKVHALYFARHDDATGRTWNPDPVLEVSDRASIYFDPRTQHKRDGMPAGLRLPMDVWYGAYFGRVQGNNKERRGYHDNQLPEAYLHRVIAACSNPGDLVMDPFTGSGTTGVVARALGRRFVGVEFSERNARSAWKRILAGLARPLADKPISTAIFSPRRLGTRPAAVADDGSPAITPTTPTPSTGLAPESAGAARRRSARNRSAEA